MLIILMMISNDFFIFVYFLFSSGIKKSKQLQIVLFHSTIHWCKAKNLYMTKEKDNVLVMVVLEKV